MKLYYDLHIHSIASPCADSTMRPQDIAGMAKIKGLDIISVVDHVSGKNMRVAAKAAKEFGLLFLPGVEVTTDMGIHMLCYFPTLDLCEIFCNMIYDCLPKKKNNIGYFGHQYIIDESDNIIGEVEKSLFLKTSYDVWGLIGIVEEYGGVVVPAHINRDIHGILTVHNDISQYNFQTVEIRKDLPFDNKYINKYKVIFNSDAHTITSILERIHAIEVKEKSVQAVFDYLKF